MKRLLSPIFAVVMGLIVLGLFVFVSKSPALALPQVAKNHIPVCPGKGGQDSARCHSRVVVDNLGKPTVSTTPSGYGPAQFLGAYNLSGSASGNPIIAIVDAFDHPNILSDLNIYSTQFGIPTMTSCSGPISTASGPCFQKVNQFGQTFSYPRKNSGWALEIALDVEVAHAICQNCKILLVEANSNSYADLMTAVDRAKLSGANVVSNSYGSGEFAGETTLDSHFSGFSGAITFSSGDSGFGAGYPASSPYVTAVGGTTLNLSGNSYLSESAWSGAGSGCSAFEPKPSFQTDPLCSNRTVADVSADADPNTGAAVYDSVRFQGTSGWFQVGGTSLSAPLIAGVYALAGTYGNSLPYSQFNYATNLHDITSGSNGSCGGTYLCTAVGGYDGPTGLGTPKGAGAF